MIHAIHNIMHFLVNKIIIMFREQIEKHNSNIR